MNKPEKTYEVPEEGSLGLLALGYTGLLLWREKREAVKQQKEAASSTKK